MCFSRQRPFICLKSRVVVCAGVRDGTAEMVTGSRSLRAAEMLLEKTVKSGAKVLTIYDPLYPSWFKNLADAPVVLYYRGRVEAESRGVAVIGARRCSEYGKKVVKEAAEFLAGNNIPVISGMAKGIDGYAHTACIRAGGKTYAFLGHGVDMCYPPEHRELMEAIIDNGIVISEYPPGIPAKQVHFPRRNYLISAWAQNLLVVEAGKNSGALLTAKIARELGREVFAVPNDIYSSESLGTNRLIADGAKVYS